jgi:hypothetical protein
MSAIDPASLLAQANCVLCYGNSPTFLQAMQIALLQNISNGVNPENPGQVTATKRTEGIVAVTANPAALTGTSVNFTKGFFYGISSFSNGVPVANQAPANIGCSASYLPDQVYQYPAGGFQIQAPPGQVFDLMNVFVSGTPGDSVFYSVS